MGIASKACEFRFTLQRIVYGPQYFTVKILGVLVSGDDRLNKSLLTNMIAASFVVVGYFMTQPLILTVGLFALSGAVTNWLAVYMLFEKVKDYAKLESIYTLNLLKGLFSYDRFVPNNFKKVHEDTSKYVILRQFNNPVETDEIGFNNLLRSGKFVRGIY